MKQNFLGPNPEVIEAIAREFGRYRILSEKYQSGLAAQFPLSNLQQVGALSAAIPASLLNAHARWKNIQSLVGLQLEPDVLNRIQREAVAWERMTSAMLPSLTAAQLPMPVPQFAWQLSTSMVASRAAALLLSETHPLLTGRLIQPYLAYSRFSRSASKQLQAPRDGHEQGALSGLLAILDQHAIATAETLEVAIEVPLDDDRPQPPVRYGLLTAVRKDLRESSEIAVGMELDDLLSLSSSAQLGSRARRLWALMRDCNEAVKVRGQHEIFKPTTKLTDACMTLPWVVADDRTSFGDVVDALYFMFYEAAGRDKLRYWDFLTADMAAIVFAIKHLRNYYLRHDPDHGSDREIHRKWKSLGDSLEWLGMTRLPRSAKEYRRLHGQLLARGEEFLEELIARI